MKEEKERKDEMEGKEERKRKYAFEKCFSQK